MDRPLQHPFQINSYFNDVADGRSQTSLYWRVVASGWLFNTPGKDGERDGLHVLRPGLAPGRRVADVLSQGGLEIGEKLGLKSTDSFGNSLNPDNLIDDVPDWFIFGWPEPHEILINKINK